MPGALRFVDQAQDRRLTAAEFTGARHEVVRTRRIGFRFLAEDVERALEVLVGEMDDQETHAAILIGRWMADYRQRAARRLQKQADRQHHLMKL